MARPDRTGPGRLLQLRLRSEPDGLNIHGADRIITEFQHLKVGDVVLLAPEGSGARVAAMEANRVLVLGGTVDARTAGAIRFKDKTPGVYYMTGWVFFLEPIDEQSTRLVERFQED